MQRDSAQNWVDQAVGLVEIQESSSLHLRNTWNLLASHLLEASRLDEPPLFLNQVGWMRTVVSARGGHDGDIDSGLRALGEAARADCGPDLAKRIGVLIDLAINNRSETYQPDSHLDEAGPLKPLAIDYLNSLIAGDRNRATQMIVDKVKTGTDIRDIYLGVLQPVLREVGRLWSTNSLSVATEHYISAATQLTMSRLYDWVFTGHHSGRVAVACCVSKEQHEIGLRMVADFYEMEGWDTHYLGGDLPLQDVCSSVQTHKAELLLLSVSGLSLLNACSKMIESVRSSSRLPVTVLVGGQAFLDSDSLWRDVGADGCASDAREAVRLGTDLVASR